MVRISTRSIGVTSQKTTAQVSTFQATPGSAQKTVLPAIQNLESCRLQVKYRLQCEGSQATMRVRLRSDCDVCRPG